MSERPTGHQVPAGTEGAAPTGTPGPPPREPSHAERCRTLVAGGTRGALSTIASDPPGYPYGSVASYGLDDRGNPLFFVSLMAEHTQNAIRTRGRACSWPSRCPTARIRWRAAGSRPRHVRGGRRRRTRGRATATSRPTRPRPYYIEFGDFVFYRLWVESIRYVGGYGR